VGLSGAGIPGSSCPNVGEIVARGLAVVVTGAGRVAVVAGPDPPLDDDDEQALTASSAAKLANPAS
jgi:hypothetical protein